jgi:hypothetical protein
MLVLVDVGTSGWYRFLGDRDVAESNAIDRTSRDYNKADREQGASATTTPNAQSARRVPGTLQRVALA